MGFECFGGKSLENAAVVIRENKNHVRYVSARKTLKNAAVTVVISENKTMGD